MRRDIAFLLKTLDEWRNEMNALIKHSAIALLVSAKDAAQMLGISPRLLWTQTHKGTIPCVRIGRTVRYSVADLNAFIDAAKSKNQTSGVSRKGGVN